MKMMPVQFESLANLPEEIGVEFFEMMSIEDSTSFEN
jgi:hypothetical protein